MAVNKIYPTIFFDVGSTLLGLNPTWEAIYHRVFQKAGFDLPLGEVEQAVSYSWNIVKDQDSSHSYETSLEYNRSWQREIERRVMDRLGIHPAVQEEIFWKIIEAFEEPSTYILYPETKNVLEKLKEQGYKLGIISNWSWHLPELCESFDIARYFEAIITSSRVGFPKPQTEIFKVGLEKLKAEPSQSLHIGDTFSADIEGAWKAGLKALWIIRPDGQWRAEPQTSLQKSIQIKNLEEIWPFLEKGVPGPQTPEF